MGGQTSSLASTLKSPRHFKADYPLIREENEYEYERKTVALVRYRHHLTFNHLLKSSEILLSSLIFTPPVRTKVGYKIARKTGIKYLRLRITQCHHSIRYLSTKLQDLKEQLENKLTPEHMRALEDAVETTSKATTVEISATHTRKYNQLKGNNKASSSNLVNKDKWVNNISERTLSPVEIAALMKGFFFFFFFLTWKNLFYCKTHKITYILLTLLTGRHSRLNILTIPYPTTQYNVLIYYLHCYT